AAEGIPPARKPWPEPLPAQIDLAELANGDPALAALAHAPRRHESDPGARAGGALAAEPRRETQYPVGWALGEGNLLLFGIPGSGTTTALASLVLSLGGVHPPETLQGYAPALG